MKLSNTNNEKKRPNIVYIIFDDTGFSDFGCYGSEIKTPNINRLAENGIRYNQFNVTPLCSPTRASLLTGRNAHSVGLGFISEADLGPDYPHTRGRITPEATTVAEILKENGFSTFAVGKWHLSPPRESSAAGPFHNWPLGRGFERFYGFLPGATDQYSPDLVYDNHRIDPPRSPDYHLTEDLIDHAIEFVTDHVSVNPERSFFMNLAFGAQHEPHQVAKEYIEKYKGVYDKGWDNIRRERYEKQKELGIIPADAELAPLNPGVKEWDRLTENEKRLFTRFQETYAGFMTHTDEHIGRFLNYLESIGELENTFIVLLADNGANHQGRFNGSTRSMPYFNKIEEQSVEEMLEQLDEIGGPNVEANYPVGWAQVGNTPFKYYKGNTHHGGIRVPLIMHWPMGIKDRNGIRTQYHHAIDVTPTVLDILDIEPPEVYKGVPQIPIQGTSMAATFENQQTEDRDTQHYLMMGHRGIYHKGWKAVTLHETGKPFEEDIWELYHVEQDFTESNNLANQYPEKLQELQSLWWKEAEKYGSLPLVDMGVNSLTKGKTKETFTFYPGMNHLPPAATPNVINRSFSIKVPVVRENVSQEGVLVAHGYHGSGYTFYIQDNHLVFEYNYVGTIYRIQSQETIPGGKNLLSFEFIKTEDYQGIGALYINNKKVGEGPIPKTMPGRVSREGLDVGKDGRAPVSPNYSDNEGFSFTGKIEKVTVELKD